MMIGVGVLAFSISTYFDSSDAASEKNHQLICTIDYLIGADRPIPKKNLARLKPKQRQALLELIRACPTLGKE